MDSGGILGDRYGRSDSGFVDFAYQSYSADDYSMVLWNHGGGAILGYGADENYGYDALSMRELDEALGSTAWQRTDRNLGIGILMPA